MADMPYDQSTVGMSPSLPPGMFNVPYNPLYNMAPATPPGWANSLQFLLGSLVTAINGGMVRPYIPPNLAVVDAYTAANVTNPLYKTMMSGVYGQLGTQVGTMAGGMQFVQSLGTMAGYSPAETKQALQGGLGAFGRSQIGSMVMPFVDSGLNALGLTGGSFVAAARATFDARMGLLTANALDYPYNPARNALVNPYNPGQMHQAMGAASALNSMLNSILSRRNAAGELMPGVDYAVTQGFSREDISQLVMQAAGMGLFTKTVGLDYRGPAAESHRLGVGGLASRMQQAMDGGLFREGARFDLSRLGTSTDAFMGKDVLVGAQDEALRDISKVRNEVEQQVRGLTRTLGAMRDLTNLVGDEAKQLLTSLTNGDWLRSREGMNTAHDALRSLGAVAKAYNLNPTSMVQQLVANRAVLQDAAGFDGAMLSMGFGGGGMFGLTAQTELVAGIEDMINAKGVRNDPILSARLRQQGVQTFARNLNSVAGRGAQVLAYVRQVGALSQDEIDSITRDFTSGDTGRMGAGLNRLLTTTFGSAEAGHRFMNNTMQMNAMRMAMDDKAGAFATMVIRNGADAEFSRREQVSFAAQRLAGTVQALHESGMNGWQSPDGVSAIVERVVGAIRGPGKDPARIAHANAFREQFDELIAHSYDPRTALSAVVSSFGRNPVTSVYSQDIDLAVKEAAAANNEDRLVAAGLPSRQVMALLAGMPRGVGGIDSAKAARLYRLVRDGRGADALAELDAMAPSMAPGTQKLYADIKADAQKRHAAAMATMSDNAEAVALLRDVQGKHYGGEKIANIYDEMAAAGRRYLETGDYDALWDAVSRSDFAGVFGPKVYEEYMTTLLEARRPLPPRDAASDAAASWKRFMEGDFIGGMAAQAYPEIADEQERARRREAANQYIQHMGRLTGTFRRAAIDTIGAAGFGLTASGFYGSGPNATNSVQLRKERDDILNRISRAEGRDAVTGAARRNGLPDDVIDFLTSGDYKKLFRVYDPDNKSGLLDDSRLLKYTETYSAYEKAVAEYNATQADYDDALKQLALSPGGSLVAHKLAVGMGADTAFDENDIAGDIAGVWGDLRAEGDPRAMYLEAIMKSVRAKNAMLAARHKNNDAVVEALDDPETRSKVLGLYRFDEANYRRRTALSQDPAVSSFLRSMDWSKEGIESAKGKKKEFLDLLFETVTPEEVAARQGAYAFEGIQRSFGETAMDIAVEHLGEKGEKGEKAEAVVKAARAASTYGATRVYGELVLRSGNDSSPATLDAQMGGL